MDDRLIILNKVIGLIFRIIAAAVVLGVVLGVLYLIFQVAVVTFFPLVITVATMLITQCVYCRHRLKMLAVVQSAHCLSIGFDSRTRQWYWQPDEANLKFYTDIGIAKLLSGLVGSISAWLCLTWLYKKGIFNKQIWWFFGRTTDVSQLVSLFLGALFLGCAVILTLSKSRPQIIFRKYLTIYLDSLISEEDKLNLDQVNALYAVALQLYVKAKQEAKKKANISLMMELEQIYQGLTSGNLSLLVQSRRWQEFELIVNGIIDDLKRIGGGSTQNQTSDTSSETDVERACRILGVSLDATDDEIRSAYRRLALRWHPDRLKSKNDSKMKEINWAYEILKENRQFA